jgi:hypothetical protein
MMLKFSLLTDQAMTAAELDRQTARSIILPMAGFSFSALLALVVLDANRMQGLRTPILLLLLSFLAFYSSLNLQSYKIRRWEDQIATGLKETASGLAPALSCRCRRCIACRKFLQAALW